MTFNHRGFSKETTFDSGPLAISGQKQLEETSEFEWRIFYFDDRATWVRLRLMLTSSTKSEQNSKMSTFFKIDNYWLRSARNFRSNLTWRYIRVWVADFFFQRSGNLGESCIEVKYLAPKLQIICLASFRAVIWIWKLLELFSLVSSSSGRKHDNTRL